MIQMFCFSVKTYMYSIFTNFFVYSSVFYCKAKQINSLNNLIQKSHRLNQRTFIFVLIKLIIITVFIGFCDTRNKNIMKH